MSDGICNDRDREPDMDDEPVSDEPAIPDHELHPENYERIETPMGVIYRKKIGVKDPLAAASSFIDAAIELLVNARDTLLNS